MKEKKSLGLKIPNGAHAALKVFAAQKNVGLIPLAENALIEASRNLEILEKAAQNSKK